MIIDQYKSFKLPVLALKKGLGDMTIHVLLLLPLYAYMVLSILCLGVWITLQTELSNADIEIYILEFSGFHPSSTF